MIENRQLHDSGCGAVDMALLASVLLTPDALLWTMDKNLDTVAIRLGALVPRPRLHLIRFHGVLAPNAKLRAAVIPQPAQKDSAPAHAHGQAARMSWARLLKRVFDIDVERCACGGQLKIIAAIEEPVVIVRILTHLGLAARAPPRAPARELSLNHAA